MTSVGSAFGGLLYITVSHGANPGNFTAAVVGAFETVTYWHGHMTLAEWTAHVSSIAAMGVGNYPPWGELVGRMYILTLPTTVLLELADPVRLMDYWDSVVAAEDLLLGYPRPGWRASIGRSERFVVDIEISAGWMHSGYPIMAYQEVSRSQVSLSHLQVNGEWGPYHELGMQKLITVYEVFEIFIP